MARLTAGCFPVATATMVDGKQQLEDGPAFTDGNFLVGNGSAWVAESGATARTSLGVAIGSDVQAYDAVLASISSLGTAADKIIYTTAEDTFAESSITAFARSILDDADEATFKATVNLEIGTDVQAYDATLQSLSSLGTAANKIAYTTDVDTWAEASITEYGRSLIDDADAAAARTTLGLVIGTDVQAQDAELAALAGLTSAANKIPYFTGSGTADLLDFKDEDDMTSNSATALSSQQSIKAYVDGYVAGYYELMEPQNNFTGSAAPTTDDDETDGYSTGSVWVNATASPDDIYYCTNASEGLAQWELISNSNWTGSSSITTVGTLTSGAINGLTGIDGTPIGSNTASTVTATKFITNQAGGSVMAEYNATDTSMSFFRIRSGATGGNYAGAIDFTDLSNTELASVRSTANGKLYLRASGSVAAIIDDSQNMAIGTTAPSGRLTVKASTADGSTDALNLQDSTGAEIAAVDSDGNADFVSLRTDSTNAWKFYGEDTTANSTACKLKVNVAGTDYWINAVKA